MMMSAVRVYPHTVASHSSIFRVVTVVLTNQIGVTFKQSWLISIAHHIVQEDRPCARAKESSTNSNRTWVGKNVEEGTAL